MKDYEFILLSAEKTDNKKDDNNMIFDCGNATDILLNTTHRILNTMNIKKF